MVCGTCISCSHVAWFMTHRITSAVTIPIEIGDSFTFNTTFYLIPKLNSLILLGNDQLQKLCIDISYHSMTITFRKPSFHSTNISFSNEASDLLHNFVIEMIAERKTRVNHNYMHRNSTDIPSQITPPRLEKHTLSKFTQQT